MQKLGPREQVDNAKKLRPIADTYSYCVKGNVPQAFPNVPGGPQVICGLLGSSYADDVTNFDEELLFLCENFEDMQKLYEHYSCGCAMEIAWYLL